MSHSREIFYCLLKVILPEFSLSFQHKSHCLWKAQTASWHPCVFWTREHARVSVLVGLVVRVYCQNFQLLLMSCQVCCPHSSQSSTCAASSLSNIGSLWPVVETVFKCELLHSSTFYLKGKCNYILKQAISAMWQYFLNNFFLVYGLSYLTNIIFL